MGEISRECELEAEHPVLTVDRHAPTSARTLSKTAPNSAKMAPPEANLIASPVMVAPRMVGMTTMKEEEEEKAKKEGKEKKRKEEEWKNSKNSKKK